MTPCTCHPGNDCASAASCAAARRVEFGDDMTTTQADALPERFTKKPVTIEAMQFRNDGSSYALIQWINEGQHAAGRRFASWQNHEIIVPTLEGEHIATPGDWIIKGVKGEFYPCKPDIFEMTYDRTALQAQPAAPEFNGWYCAHCQRGVDAIEVTYHEQHTVCGRVITNDAPPAPQPAAAGVSDDVVTLCRWLADTPHQSNAINEKARAILALRPQAVPMTDEQEALEEEEFSLLSQTQIAALLWVLWCHQGASSPVGQPIRFALGMDKRQAMSDEQVSAAQRFRIDWHQWSGITAPAGGEGKA